MLPSSDQQLAESYSRCTLVSLSLVQGCVCDFVSRRVGEMNYTKGLEDNRSVREKYCCLSVLLLWVQRRLGEFFGGQTEQTR